MPPSPTLARRFWQSFEPVHCVTYFTPEPAEVTRALGLAKWWTGYFAGRVAPLGPVGGPAAAALFFAFSPAKTGHALPEAWRQVSPEQVLRARLPATREALDRTLPADRAGLPRLVELLELAVTGCGFEGRPLAAAWSAVPPPDDLLTRLWLATTVLREHRGDGHVIAVAHADLTGLEAGLTHVATGDVTAEVIQGTRGWTDEEWEQARRRLVARGLLDRGGRLTKAGGTLRRDLETTTDRLAADPVMLLGESGVAEVIELATPLSRHLVDTGVFPLPNPVGVPRP
ncbi:SCO6745 family protein [Kitasatospora viridis]|uniref:SalK n=1 Tax=Kitasatospora viridis TaxID=281105 RepID=A0A561UI56_9ACTN|nr:hypothetical protein [Kitasatospora viridis]TWF99038.1 hypothetical protein FHX73_112874 [Kitasatospora viridis]